MKYLLLLCLLPGALAANIERLLQPLPESIETPVQIDTVEQPDAQVTVAPIKKAEPEKVTVTAEELLQEVTYLLGQRYQVEGDLQLKLRQPLEPLTLGSEIWEVEFTRFPPYGLAPRMILYVRVRCAETVKDLQLPVNAEVMREVYMSQRRINRGDTLEPAHFEIQRHDVLGEHKSAVAANVDLTDYELERSVAANEPLDWDSLRLRPTIRKGQIVDVSAVSGTMTINMKGEALEDGLRGDVIDIRNLTSRKNFQAQVINAQSVRVHF